MTPELNKWLDSGVRGYSIFMTGPDACTIQTTTTRRIVSIGGADGELNPSTPELEAAAAHWRTLRGEQVRRTWGGPAEAPPPPEPQPAPVYGEPMVNGHPTGVPLPHPNPAPAHAWPVIETSLKDGTNVKLDGLTVGEVRDGKVWTPDSGSERINAARRLIQEGALCQIDDEGNLS